MIEKLFRERWGKYDGLGALILTPTRELALQIFDELRKVSSRSSTCKLRSLGKASADKPPMPPWPNRGLALRRVSMLSICSVQSTCRRFGASMFTRSFLASNLH